MIIVECYNDRELVYRMGFIPSEVRHEFGRSRVLGIVEQGREPVIGIIDEDPTADRPPVMEKYQTQRTSKKSITLLKRRDDDTKWLVQISPRLEDWLCEIARRNRISPQRFGLPDDPAGLHSISLRKDKQNFQRFLDALRWTGDNEINALNEWIRQAIG